jgi:hypothetical protein
MDDPIVVGNISYSRSADESDLEYFANPPDSCQGCGGLFEPGEEIMLLLGTENHTGEDVLHGFHDACIPDAILDAMD